MRVRADIGDRDRGLSGGSADASVYESLFVGTATHERPVRGAAQRLFSPTSPDEGHGDE